MSFLFFILNLGLMVYCWRAAEEYFDYEMNMQGWLNLFVSALNGASVLNYLVS